MANMGKAAEYYQQIVRRVLNRQGDDDPTAMIAPLSAAQAFTEMAAHWLKEPEKLFKYQLDFFNDYMALMTYGTQRLLGEKQEPLYTPAAKDNRFKDEAWQHHPMFDFLKQYYLFTSQWMDKMVAATTGMDKKDKQKVDFYTRQFLDAISPSNFLMTNPVALKETMETNGQSLVKGMQNLLEDMERSGAGVLNVLSADLNAFEIGKNIAATPGNVVFQNDLMQLIHYAPLTPQQYARPVLVMPAWINKYYILDLQPKNSLVKWLLEQGYSVFMISWVNPDKHHAKKSFEDYMSEGPLAALDAIEKATGQREVTAMGYCLGGTLLACTLAYMKAKKDTRIQSATFLTTMIDFGDVGDLGVFIDEDQISAMEARMGELGYLDGKEMAMTFSMLRANDMIWSFVVNNYLLGKDPFPFDLLYWNADATRLPAAMHSFYLRNMYLKNILKNPGGVTLKGVKIDVSTIDIPTYFLSTREDHIAPWKTTFAAMKLLGKSAVRFVLSGSGHVGGVVNPPEKQKYGYWTNDARELNTEKWLADAKEHAGSWWVDWDQWNRALSGEKGASYTPQKGLEPAPGSFVGKR